MYIRTIKINIRQEQEYEHKETLCKMKVMSKLMTDLFGSVRSSRSQNVRLYVMS